MNVNTASREVLHALIDGLSDGAGDVTGYVDDIMVLREDNLLQNRQIESGERAAELSAHRGAGGV